MINVFSGLVGPTIYLSYQWYKKIDDPAIVLYLWTLLSIPGKYVYQ